MTALPRSVVLFGPPTAGKDTVTAALAALDGRFTLVTKLKVGSGRSAGYRFVSRGELDSLRSRSRLLVETHRYGNIYAVDRADLADLLSQGRVPVVHIGNTADLRILTSGAPQDWLRVLLWVPREVCALRSRLRNDTDTAARLAAWDQTLADLRTADRAGLFDLGVRTDQADPESTARRIAQALRNPPPAPLPAAAYEELALGADPEI